MRNIAISLKYDGTAYHGWQRQKNVITVQEALERATEKVCGAYVHVAGCGRTDAGVHAEKYCANFHSETRIPNDRLPLALNSVLPEDIAVVAAVDAEEDFNAVLSCKKKEYTYTLYNSRLRNPFFRNRAYFYPAELNMGRMSRAAEAFEGTHDFSAVRSVGTDVKSTIRTVYYFQIEKKDDIIKFKVCANGFLYNMARAMVGTVIYASLGKIVPEEIPELLAIGDRRLTGPTVPSQGLAMTKIWYDGPVGNMMNG